MNALTRRFATLVATLALAATAAGCANTPTATPTADAADSQAVLDALNNANEITATKSLFSWGDEWAIEADGQQIGTVTGQAIYAIGDVYSLTTMNGNLVASETEEMNAITHTATLYDWGNQPTGTLEERVLALTPTVDIHHTDANGSDTINGTATTAFALSGCCSLSFRFFARVTRALVTRCTALAAMLAAAFTSLSITPCSGQADSLCVGCVTRWPHSLHCCDVLNELTSTTHPPFCDT
jgi:hypothetical protein